MKLYLTPVTLALFFMLSSLSAQTPIWKYARTGSSGQVDKMQTDSSGNLYVIGHYYADKFSYQDRSVKGNGTIESSNLFLLKTAHTGRTIWLHSMYCDDSLGSVNYEKSVVTLSGELVVAFTVSGKTFFHVGGYTFPNDSTTDNFYIAKFSKTGFLTWVKKASAKSGISQPSIKLTDMATDTSGAVVITGWFSGATASIGTQSIAGEDTTVMMFLSMISSDGNVSWMTGCNYNAASGSGSIFPTKVKVANNNLIYVAGYYTGNRKFNFGPDTLINNSGNNTFLSCYSYNGNASWGKSFAGELDDFPGSLVTGKDGSVFFDGFFNSKSLLLDAGFVSASSPGYDLFLTHYDGTGKILKTVIYPLQKQLIDYSGPNDYLSVDPSGNLVFCSTYAGSTLFTNSDTLINSDPGTNDIAFAKFDQSTLSPIWTAQVTGIGDNYYDGIFIDPDGNVILAGTLFNNVTMTNVSITANATNGSPYLVFVKNDGTRNYLFYKNNSSTDQLYMQQVVSDKYGNAYVAGTFSGTGNLLGNDSLKSSGADGLFLGRYGRTKNLTGSVQNDNSYRIGKAYVKLFGYTWAQRSPISDSVGVDAYGNFIFKNVPFGKYIIKAFPQYEFENDYIPTYYPNSDNWENAQTIMINQQSTTDSLNITLIWKTLGGGQSTLEGQIFEQDSSDFYKSTQSTGRPEQKAQVILAKKSKSTIQTYYITSSDENGNFSFTNVLNGTYYCWVEIAGLPTTDIYSVDVLNNQFISSLNYLVGEDKITKLSNPVYSSIPENQISTDITVGPNPANNMLLVDLENIPSGTLIFYNLEGAVIRNQSIRQGMNSIDVSNIPKGTYLLRLVTNEKTVVKKISIIH